MIMIDYEKIAALITIISTVGAIATHVVLNYKKISTIQKQINVINDTNQKINSTDIVKDVAELKAKINILLNQEDRPYFILDKYGRAKWVNEEFCNFTERIKEDLLGYGWTL